MIILLTSCSRKQNISVTLCICFCHNQHADSGFQFFFTCYAGKIDAEAERKKLADDLAYYEGFLASVMKKLSNERFVASAPEKVVANERAKQADAEAKITAIREQLAALESGK